VRIVLAASYENISRHPLSVAVGPPGVAILASRTTRDAQREEYLQATGGDLLDTSTSWPFQALSPGARVRRDISGVLFVAPSFDARRASSFLLRPGDYVIRAEQAIKTATRSSHEQPVSPSWTKARSNTVAIHIDDEPQMKVCD
jgi:hypothetical protein